MAKPGSVAGRWKARHFPPGEDKSLGETEKGQLRAFLGDENFGVFLGVIGTMAKRSRSRIFADGVQEQERLDEAFKIRVLRDIMTTLYRKADVPMPEKLSEVLS